MTKNELAIQISKKAKVPDNLAKELFDIFLIRIADKITVGQTAHLENIGYFHLRKGKIRKPEKDLEKETFESHDFIVLAQSPDLNIKAPENLVLMVPEIEIQKRDEVDAHFRLSVEKPGMHNVKDRGTVYRLNQLSFIKRNELKEKVDKIISEIKTERSISSKHGVLLVEMKKFNKDQLELNVDDIPVEKESLDLSNDKINSFGKPKSTDELLDEDHLKRLGEDSTQKNIEEKSIESEITDKTDLNVEARNWETVSEPNMDQKIELDKNVYKNSAEMSADENDLSNNVQDGIKKSNQGASKNLDNNGKQPSGSGDDNVNRKFKRIKLKGQSADNKSSNEKKVYKSIPLKEIDINKEKEKEKISYKEKKLEEDSDKKVEQEKESSKIVDEEKASLKEEENINEKVKPNENKKYEEVISGEDQMHTEKFKEPSKIKESLATMSKLEEDEHAYDAEIDETYQVSGRRGSGMAFLIFFAAIIVIGGGLYYFLIHRDSGSNELNQTLQFDNAVNTTYVDRNYDVPVSYPYSQPESEVELHGLSPELISVRIPEEQSGIEESTSKAIGKETSPPVTNEKVTTPPVINETKIIPEEVKTDIVPSKPREQVSQNIFKYDGKYAVQVAAFATKQGAEDGAAKYMNRGYSAFIEEAVVKGKNWYRLRVGGFKTLEEAKKFQKSNK